MEQDIVKSPGVPKESFTALVSAKIFKMSAAGIESDEDYNTLPIPSISNKYFPFIERIKQLDYEERYIYLLTTFGGLNTANISELMGISFDEAKKRMVSISSKAQNIPNIKAGTRDFVYIST